MQHIHRNWLLWLIRTITPYGNSSFGFVVSNQDQLAAAAVANTAFVFLIIISSIV